MKRPILFLAFILFLSPVTSCSILNIRSGVNFNTLNLDYAESRETDITDEAAALQTIMPDIQSASSTLDITDADFDASNRTGFFIGLSLSDVLITEKLTFQPEVNYFGIKDFNQIQVPALLNYEITNRLNAHAGPAFSYLLNAPVNVKTTNLAMDFGASYNISEKIAIEARYDLGLSNLLEGATSDNHLKMSNVQIGLTYRLGTSQ